MALKIKIQVENNLTDMQISPSTSIILIKNCCIDFLSSMAEIIDLVG